MPEVVVSGISSRFRGLSRCEGQIAHVLLTRSPLVYSRRSLTARLACVKHAASVRPEPGSNSPLNSSDSHSFVTVNSWCYLPARERLLTIVRIIVCLTKGTADVASPARGRIWSVGRVQINSSTFGTLLSSQGSSAHRSQASRPFRGATCKNLPGRAPRSQIRSASPAPRATASTKRVPQAAEARTRTTSEEVSIRVVVPVRPPGPLGLASCTSGPTRRNIRGAPGTGQIGSGWSGSHEGFTQVSGLSARLGGSSDSRISRVSASVGQPASRIDSTSSAPSSSSARERALLASRGEGVEHRPSHEGSIGAQRRGEHHVQSRAHSPVDVHLDPAGHGRAHRCDARPRWRQPGRAGVRRGSRPTRPRPRRPRSDWRRRRGGPPSPRRAGRSSRPARPRRPAPGPSPWPGPPGAARW